MSDDALPVPTGDRRLMNKTERIHRICQHLRGEECRKCPESEPPAPGYEEYGRTQRMCYSLAEEVYNLAAEKPVSLPVEPDED